MSKQHPVIHGFGKWLAWQVVFDMIVWIFLPKWNPLFLQVLIKNLGNGLTYYDFWGFWWFLFTMGGFIGFVIWPSFSKRSFLR